jgi:hypothetical protein
MTSRPDGAPAQHLQEMLRPSAWEKQSLLPPGPRPTDVLHSGNMSCRTLGALANEAVVDLDEPHPTVELEPAPPRTSRVVLAGRAPTRPKHRSRRSATDNNSRSVCPPCHSRAISEGQSRYRAGNHGHCHPTAELAVSRSSSMNAFPRMCLIRMRSAVDSVDTAGPTAAAELAALGEST